MQIRWGIIGCGNVTEVKSGPGFQKAEGSALVAVMRRDAAAARDYAARHNVPRWYSDADKLINDLEVDAVYVATPPGSHLEYALRIAAAGKPAYVEKPMARSHAECQRMIEAFAARKLPLFVAFYRRALPRFLKARELVQGGAIGTLTGVLYRCCEPRHREAAKPLPWRLIAQQSGGGIFLDLGSHTLDVIDFIVGPLQDVTGIAANVASSYDVEDVVAMSFRTPGGAAGAATWNFASDYRADEIEFIGTDGRLALSTFSEEPVRLQRGESLETFDIRHPPHVQQPLIQSIVDQLLGRGTCPSTGESAARTAKVMDTVLAGYYGGRDDAWWTRPESWPGRRRG